MARRADPLTPVEAAWRRRAQIRFAVFVLVVAILAVFATLLFNRYASNRPVTYSNIEDHFKYGSIGSDYENGLPLRILQVLPRMFPEYMPAGGHDYTAFGFLQEPDHPLPIGFSVRRHYIDLAGLNCASCHVGEVQASADAKPRDHPRNAGEHRRPAGFLRLPVRLRGRQPLHCRQHHRGDGEGRASLLHRPADLSQRRAAVAGGRY